MRWRHTTIVCPPPPRVFRSAYPGPEATNSGWREGRVQTKKSPTDIDVLASKRGRKSIFPLRTGRLSGSETGARSKYYNCPGREKKKERSMHDDSWIFSFPFIHFSRKGKKRGGRRRGGGGMFWSTWPPIKVILKNFLKKTDCSQRLLRKSRRGRFSKITGLLEYYWNI